MKTELGPAVVLAGLLLLGACTEGGIAELSNTDSEDNTGMASYSDASLEQAVLYSAYYGLDDAVPFFASYRICREFGHTDGMPVIFSKEVDINTLEAGDFVVTLADGQKVKPGCVTPAPAEDLGEFRTILTIGDFGSIENQPVSVEVTGNLVSLDQQSNFRGSRVAVTPLEAGPSLVFAEIVGRDQWQLNKEPTILPFGGGSGCPASTQQIVRAVWSGGVTKPGGDEIGEQERSAYRVYVTDEEGKEVALTPFAIADLGDGDNNHKLCLDVVKPVLRIEFPAGLMTDPRDDLNPATSVLISH